MKRSRRAALRWAELVGVVATTVGLLSFAPTFKHIASGELAVVGLPGPSYALLAMVIGGSVHAVAARARSR